MSKDEVDEAGLDQEDESAVAEVLVGFILSVGEEFIVDIFVLGFKHEVFLFLEEGLTVVAWDLFDCVGIELLEANECDGIDINVQVDFVHEVGDQGLLDSSSAVSNETLIFTLESFADQSSSGSNKICQNNENIDKNPVSLEVLVIALDGELNNHVDDVENQQSDETFLDNVIACAEFNLGIEVDDVF